MLKNYRKYIKVYEVNMKCLWVGFGVLLLFGCATIDNVKNFNNLDLAVEKLCSNIASDFNQEASIAVFSINSPSIRLSGYIQEEVMHNFTNMHKYNIVERSRISAIQEEQTFQFSGNVSDDTIQRIGNMLGAQFVITGEMDDAGGHYRLRLYMLSVESGERISSAVVNVNKPNQQIMSLLENNSNGTLIPEWQNAVIGYWVDPETSLENYQFFHDGKFRGCLDMTYFSGTYDEKNIYVEELDGEDYTWVKLEDRTCPYKVENGELFIYGMDYRPVEKYIK
jgi:TolB-like protein